MKKTNENKFRDHRYCDYGIDKFENLIFNTSEDFIKKLDERKVYCKHCGHPMYMHFRQEETICSYCNHKIKKEGKILFKDKMRVLLNEEKYGKRN